MKKQGVFHGRLSQIIATMGHGDTICIADVGLPIPDQVECIDLAVSPNVPAFLQVLTVVVEELAVEGYQVAEETRQHSPQMWEDIAGLLAQVEAELTDHESLKAATHNCRAVVRTGQCTPYANVILRAGVTF